MVLHFIFWTRVYLAVGCAAAIILLSRHRHPGLNATVGRHPLVAGLIALFEWPLLLAIVIWNFIARWRRTDHR